MSSFGLNELSCQSLIENLWDLDFSKYNRYDLETFCNVLNLEYRMMRKKYTDICEISNIKPSYSLSIYSNKCPYCNEIVNIEELNKYGCCERCASL